MHVLQIIDIFFFGHKIIDILEYQLLIYLSVEMSYILFCKVSAYYGRFKYLSFFFEGYLKLNLKFDVSVGASFSYQFHAKFYHNAAHYTQWSRN